MIRSIFRSTHVFCVLVAIGLAACSTTPSRTHFDDAARYGQPFTLYTGRVEEIPAQQSRVLTLDLTRDPNDIWDRIRRGFAMPDLDSELVTSQQLRYLSHAGSLRTVFERGGQYLYFIVSELERRGLPTELALLPMVESSFDPNALSSARASGLWQFIPSTGRAYNLAQDHWRDERRDVIASTRAALDYLEYIYEMHGDWHLALASYNWGEGAVLRAVQANVAAGGSGEYRDLRMPAETRNYIPRLQALKNIVAHPELFNFDLPYIHNDQVFTTVDVPRGTDLRIAAELADMPFEEFRALNPGYKRTVVNDGVALLIPLDRVESFRHRLSQQRFDAGPQQRYTVQGGDTLAGVARRHNVDLDALRSLNNLGSQAALQAGQTLLVPDRTAALAAPTSSSPATEVDAPPRALARATPPAAPAPPAPPKPAVPKPEPKTVPKTRTEAKPTQTPTAATRAADSKPAPERRHRVTRGETLSGIAQRYQISVARLRELNGLAPRADLRAGQVLSVSAPAAPVAAPGKPAPAGKPFPSGKPTPPAADPAARPRSYRVRRGDTLSSIASKFDIDLAELRRANQLDRRATIRHGQALTIPAPARSR